MLDMAEYGVGWKQKCHISSHKIPTQPRQCNSHLLRIHCSITPHTRAAVSLSKNYPTKNTTELADSIQTWERVQNSAVKVTAARTENWRNEHLTIKSSTLGDVTISVSTSNTRLHTHQVTRFFGGVLNRILKITFTNTGANTATRLKSWKGPQVGWTPIPSFSYSSLPHLALLLYLVHPIASPLLFFVSL